MFKFKAHIEKHKYNVNYSIVQIHKMYALFSVIQPSRSFNDVIVIEYILMLLQIGLMITMPNSLGTR